MTPELTAPVGRKAPKLAAQRGNPASGRNPSPDWNPDSGIVDQMLAYSDWWNVRAPKGNGSHRQTPKPERP